MPVPPESPEPPPSYTRYRARPRVFDRKGDALARLRRDGGRPGAPTRPRSPITVGRVVKWLAIAAIGWIGLSLVLFLISAQTQKSNVDDAAKAALAGNGRPPFTPTTVLFLGSDQRTKRTKEPGASTSGPSRSDSILLMRVGGGHNARLSIPRDTVVTIPGHGESKINAAYAYGGPALAVQTVEKLTGVDVDHLVEVSFENFPQLIDAMGGITYDGGCVVSKINGGFKNGGFTLRLKSGKTHINGKQALALARTRHNLCNARENDLTRARRQQKIFSSMKHRLFSPTTFVRMPWVAWNVPKAIQSDMSGPALLGMVSALAASGSPDPNVLKPDGAVTLPDGGAGLHVADTEVRQKVRAFLKD